MNTTMNTKQSTKVQVGDWVYHPETLVVCYSEGTFYEYEVDLEQCTTSAEMLDWILQLEKKDWTDSETVWDLVKILNRLLYPQKNLCSWGEEQGPLPKGNALRKMIADHILQSEIRDRWKQSLKAKHGTKLYCIEPEDWKELECMEREAGLKPKVKNGGSQL